MDKKYIVEEIAKQLKVSKRTVLREIKRGNLPSERVGRRYLISQKSLNRYLKRDGGNVYSSIKRFLSSKKSEMVDLLQKMVTMASSTQEKEQELLLANFVGSYLDQNKIRSVVYRENDAVVVRGSLGWADKGLLFDSPLDTTPAGDERQWKYPPYDGIVKGGRMYGRGTADCKAGIVAMIYACLALKKYADEEKYRVELVFDGGEQDGSYLGMKLALKKGLPVDVGIVGYAGDEHEILIGARGYHRYEFKTKGRSAHTGARVRVGINAINKMVDFIGSFRDKDLPKPKDKRFSFGQRMSFSTIAGGRAINIVPDECSAKLDVRTSPDFKKKLVDSLIDDKINVLKKKDEQFDISYKYLVGSEGYVIRGDSKIIRVLRKSVDDYYREKHGRVKINVTGPAHIGNLLYEHDVPVVLWGPRGTNVHSYDEYVELDSIPETAIVYANTALDFFN
jgi:excisionase family DNA binding protein